MYPNFFLLKPVCLGGEVEGEGCFRSQQDCHITTQDTKDIGLF